MHQVLLATSDSISLSGSRPVASARFIRGGIGDRARAKHRRAGFTLADVTITVLIIGILAAVTTPRLAGTYDQLKLDAAAKHVAADLRYARQLARAKGKNQSVTFTPAVDTYQLDGASDIDHSSKPFIVVLPELKYSAQIDSATFGLGHGITFNMHGRPDNGGSVVLSRDGDTRTVQVNATTGKVSVL